MKRKINPAAYIIGGFMFSIVASIVMLILTISWTGKL